ncbi:unnamed protein product [Vitrella brassicaformis CCMP3155]|uniref:TLC domain-containing protein n=2 Tax=Vitrella brassicaformis TaxID=1169539 RepID=A0A0G4EIY9_VITBC|nr:unnamed protein product [Vitrella brassicaformis CCMP3155]|eukprot:CEL96981.1 unnamed protein product [Vitrella brassicaformis CCMP3155]
MVVSENPHVVHTGLNGGRPATPNAPSSALEPPLSSLQIPAKPSHSPSATSVSSIDSRYESPLPAEGLSPIVGLGWFLMACVVGYVVIWPFSDVPLRSMLMLDSPWFFAWYVGLVQLQAAVFLVSRMAIRALGAKYKDEQKADGWILTTASGVVLTVCGVYVIPVTLAEGDLLGAGFRAVVASNPTALQVVCVLFVAALHTDCVLGTLFYPRTIDVLSGWVHHGVYTVIMLYALASKQVWIFMLFGIDEIPTVMLGIGNIHVPWRFDWSFGIAFWLTRVVWHTCVLGLLLYHRIWMADVRLSVTLVFVTLSLAMHCHWITNWASKKVKNHRNKKKEGKGE